MAKDRHPVSEWECLHGMCHEKRTINPVRCLSSPWRQRADSWHAVSIVHDECVATKGISNTTCVFKETLAIPSASNGLVVVCVVSLSARTVLLTQYSGGKWLGFLVKSGGVCLFRASLSSRQSAKGVISSLSVFGSHQGSHEFATLVVVPKKSPA